MKPVLPSKEHRLMVEELSFARSQDRTSPLSLVEAVAASWAKAKNDLMKGKEEEEAEELCQSTEAWGFHALREGGPRFLILRSIPSLPVAVGQNFKHFHGECVLRS